MVVCSWAVLLPRDLITTDPLRYMWSPPRFMPSRGTDVIGPEVNRIGMTTEAFGGSRVSRFVIEFRR